MKNLFRLGFIALALTTCLTACDFFRSSPKTPPIDSSKIDSSQIDSNKIDTNAIDATKIKPDSIK